MYARGWDKGLQKRFNVPWPRVSGRTQGTDVTAVTPPILPALAEVTSDFLRFPLWTFSKEKVWIKDKMCNGFSHCTLTPLPRWTSPVCAGVPLTALAFLSGRSSGRRPCCRPAWATTRCSWRSTRFSSRRRWRRCSSACCFPRGRATARLALASGNLWVSDTWRWSGLWAVRGPMSGLRSLISPGDGWEGVRGEDVVSGQTRTALQAVKVSRRVSGFHPSNQLFI